MALFALLGHRADIRPNGGDAAQPLRIMTRDHMRIEFYSRVWAQRVEPLANGAIVILALWLASFGDWRAYAAVLLARVTFYGR